MCKQYNNFICVDSSSNRKDDSDTASRSNKTAHDYGLKLDVCKCAQKGEHNAWLWGMSCLTIST